MSARRGRSVALQVLCTFSKIDIDESQFHEPVKVFFVRFLVVEILFIVTTNQVGLSRLGILIHEVTLGASYVTKTVAL